METESTHCVSENKHVPNVCKVLSMGAQQWSETQVCGILPMTCDSFLSTTLTHQLWWVLNQNQNSNQVSRNSKSHLQQRKFANVCNWKNNVDFFSFKGIILEGYLISKLWTVSTMPRGKDKLISMHVIKAYRGKRGAFPLILNLGTKWGYVVSLTLLLLYSWGKNPH